MRKSLTFDNQRKQWLYLLEGREKAPFAPIRNNLVKIPNKPGAIVSSKETDVMYIHQPVGFIVKDDRHELEIKDELARWLIKDDAVPLEFDDEPGRIYYAHVEGTIEDFSRFVKQRKGIITFLVPDSHSYGQEQLLELNPTSTIIENKGSELTEPIIELTAKEKVTYAMIENGLGEYNLIGRPADVDEVEVDEKTLVLEESGRTLDDWTSNLTSVDGTVSGQLTQDGTGIVVQSYGTGSGWHGPALTKEITPIQDFEVEMRLRVESTNPKNAYRIEFYLFDENMNVLGKMAIVDATQARIQYAAEGRYGKFTGKHDPNYVISSRNYLRERGHFHGMLRMRRIGRMFEFYVARIGHTGEAGFLHHDTMTQTFLDIGSEHQGRLKYVQVHIGKYGNTPNARTPRINSIEVFRHNKLTIDQTPYILHPGDRLTLDHKLEEVLINGEDAMMLKHFGAQFWRLLPGHNTVMISPPGAFDTTVRFKEKYK